MDESGSGAVGLLRLPQGVLMVASQPILTSERKDLSRGRWRWRAFSTNRRFRGTSPG